MPAKELDDLDDFLGDNKRGGGTLSSWKEDGEITIWLARLPVGKPVSLWRHPFPSVTLKDDADGNPERKVFMFPWAVCHEDEKVLKGQHFYKDNGEREHPPLRCPICRFREWVRGEVESGALDIAKVIMRVEATDPSKTMTLHAGGIYNYGGSKKLREDEKLKKKLKDAGIYVKDAFKENMTAKHEYLLRVVDNADLGAGVQKIFVSGDLGDKLKDVIAKARVDLGKDEGNPYLNPYAFKLIYREKETQLNKKYDVQKLGKEPFTEEVDEAISGEGPDVSQLMEPFNRASLRANLQRWCLLKNVPWDEIFAPYEDGEDRADKEPRRRGEESGARSTGAAPAAPPAEDATPRRRKKAAKDEPPPPKEETIPCDECKAPMPVTAKKCQKCGTEYEVIDDDEKPAEPGGKGKGKKAKDESEPAPDDNIPF